MQSHQILEYPNEELRKPSKQVIHFDGNLQKLCEELFKVLDVHGGIGLSAPQIGIAQRVSIVYVPDDEFGKKIYVNPKIISKTAIGIVEESCLSVPGVVGNVIRATQMIVQAYDQFGEKFETQLSGMHAVCLQHEMDHLDGKLFIDKLSWFKRKSIKRKFRNQKQQVCSIN